MGIVCAPDIFQNEMASLMSELEHVRVYLDDLLVITKGDFQDHLQKLDEVLEKLMKGGLKVNLKNFFWLVLKQTTLDIESLWKD